MHEKEDRLLTIMSVIFFIVSFLGFIFGLVNNDIRLIIPCAILFLLFGISFYFLMIINYLDKYKNIKNKKIKIFLSNKSDLNGYEQLIYDVLCNKAVTILSEKSSKQKNKKLYNITLDYDNKKIICKYNYCNFYIYCRIFVNKIKIRIFKPEKFKYGSVNETLKFKINKKINFENMLIEDLYIYLENLIKKINYDIKEYRNINKDNNIINYKTLSNLNYHMNNEKIYYIIYIICGIEFTFFGCAFTYQCLIGNKSFTTENVIGAWIFSILFLIFGLFLTFISIKKIKQNILFTRDKKEQKCEIIEGECIKVRFFADGLGRNTKKRILRSITFIINTNEKNVKIYLKVDKIYEPSTIDWYQLKTQLLNKRYKFKYLKNSRIIISCDPQVSIYLKDL